MPEESIKQVRQGEGRGSNTARQAPEVLDHGHVQVLPRSKSGQESALPSYRSPPAYRPPQTRSDYGPGS